MLPFHASCENKAQIITCQSTCTFIGSGQHSYYLNLFLLTGGAGKLEEIPGRLAAQRGQLGAASEEIHRGACHQLVCSYFSVLVLLVIGSYVAYTFTLHILKTLNNKNRIQCRLLKYPISQYLYPVHCSTVVN